MTTRSRALLCCLWFGLIPWQIYERKRHYDGGYLGHLWLNIGYAFRWMTCREGAIDVLFEWRVNARPRWTRWHR
jgi:hypothetical protein